MAETPNAWTHPDSDPEAAVKHLVENTDLSPLQAKELVAQHGSDRETLMKLAKTMKAES